MRRGSLNNGSLGLHGYRWRWGMDGGVFLEVMEVQSELYVVFCQACPTDIIINVFYG